MSKTALIVNVMVSPAERRQKERTGLTWGEILRLGLATALAQIAAADKAEGAARDNGG
jgi:hypothetical protein